MIQETFSNNEQAVARFKLANIWYVKGKIELAIAAYQDVLRLQPDYAPAYQQLGNAMLYQQHEEVALRYYEKALSLDFSGIDLSFYYRYHGVSKFGTDTQASRTIELQKYSTPYIQDNPQGKINLNNQITFDFHRSGWGFAINALKPLHNSQGILFEGVIENNFSWKHSSIGKRPALILDKMCQDGVFDQVATLEEQGIIPYTQPWAGFIHNPPGVPKWFFYETAPQTIFTKDIWKQSLDACVGLFALSEYHAQWLREQTGKPVSALIHPTEIPEQQFNFERFIANPCKKIVQIGWWLRKLNSIYRLPVSKGNCMNYEKVRLVPRFCDNADKQIQQLMEKEIEYEDMKIDPEILENTKKIQQLPEAEYDQLLSENIAFVELYDSSANNAVIECIARATPLLINPLPAVVEYLGKDYPMYFSSLSEAADKALNTSLILETHQYLKTCETRQKLSLNYFLKSFQESDVYQLI